MSTPTDSLSCCKTEVKEESSLGGTDTDFIFHQINWLLCTNHGLCAHTCYGNEHSNNLMVSEGYGLCEMYSWSGRGEEKEPPVTPLCCPLVFTESTDSFLKISYLYLCVRVFEFHVLVKFSFR